MQMRNQPTYEATVIRCKEEIAGSGIFLLELKFGMDFLFHVLAGQFIMLAPLIEGSQAVRPFTVAWLEKNVVSLLISVVGKNTQAYSQLNPGDTIKIIGPQGSPIPYDSQAESFILVGGRTGAAALTMFAQDRSAEEKKVTALLGAPTEHQLCGRELFRRVGVDVETITDYGNGRNGFVTVLLKEKLKVDGGKSQVVACGPKRMLEAVAKLCWQYGNKCLVGLEEMMACGMEA